MGDDKVYEGTIKFGEATDSYDCDGEITASLPVPLLTLEQLNEEAAKFIGDQMQMPPMVSAIKKNGVPLYKLARKGIEVEREPRLVHIYNFRFTKLRRAARGNSAWPARRALTSAASRTTSARSSAAART